MASSSRMVHTDSPSCSTNSCSAAVPALGRGCCHALRVDRKRFAQGGNTDRQHGRDDCRPCPGRRRRARHQQDPTVLTGGRPHARELVSEALTLETAVERFLRWRHRIHAEISTHDHAHHWGGERYALDRAALRHAARVAPARGQEPPASSCLASAPHHGQLGRVQLGFPG